MTTAIKRRGDLIRVKQYITDSKGHKVAAVIEIEELIAVKKAIQYLSANPRHPGLQTHEFTSLKGPKGEKVFEAYAEQFIPAAYRIFWYYGAGQNQITVIAITPHP